MSDMIGVNNGLILFLETSGVRTDLSEFWSSCSTKGNGNITTGLTYLIDGSLDRIRRHCQYSIASPHCFATLTQDKADLKVLDASLLFNLPNLVGLIG